MPDEAPPPEAPPPTPPKWFWDVKWVAMAVAIAGSTLSGGYTWVTKTWAERHAKDVAASVYTRANKESESGYQAHSHKDDEQDSRLLVLEQAAKARELAERAKVKGRPRRPPVPVVVNAHPIKLPPNLDEAVKQIAPPKPAAPDAGP